MRYLYADSTPFPFAFDFLAGLERLLLHGGRIAALQAEIEQLETEREMDAEITARALEGVDRWVEEAKTALQTADVAADDAGPLSESLSERLQKLVDQLAGETEAAEQARLRRENGAAHDQSVAHRRVMRDELQTLFLQTELGAQPSQTVIRLRESDYGFTVTRAFPGDVKVDYLIAEDGVPDWDAKRTVASVAGAMEVQVGMKKKFLRRDMTRELVRIGDLIVTEARLLPSSAEVRLEKKPGSKKAPLLLELSRDGEAVDVTIERESDDGMTMFPAVPSDAEKLEGLWESLEETAQRAFAARASVAAVRVDGHDVLAEGHALLAIDRIGRAFAPVVRELATRTPNDHELTLKVEGQDGKREERYIRRRDLHALLEEAGTAAVERLGYLTAL
ncbi:MAG: hypothetical protein JJ863_11055 [Deltaproteobacteria bacterium]|nr:hypothetical protein [Deltaproteobacteria bacterium]